MAWYEWMFLFFITVVVCKTMARLYKTFTDRNKNIILLDFEDDEGNEGKIELSFKDQVPDNLAQQIKETMNNA